MEVSNVLPSPLLNVCQKRVHLTSKYDEMVPGYECATPPRDAGLPSCLITRDAALRSPIRNQRTRLYAPVNCFRVGDNPGVEGQKQRYRKQCPRRDFGPANSGSGVKTGLMLPDCIWLVSAIGLFDATKKAVRASGRRASSHLCSCVGGSSGDSAELVSCGCHAGRGCPVILAVSAGHA
jgi:hypothetical protein